MAVMGELTSNRVASGSERIKQELNVVRDNIRDVEKKTDITISAYDLRLMNDELLECKERIQDYHASSFNLTEQAKGYRSTISNLKFLAFISFLVGIVVGSGIVLFTR